jgi:hypothetical protein
VLLFSRSKNVYVKAEWENGQAIWRIEKGNRASKIRIGIGIGGEIYDGSKQKPMNEKEMCARG